MTRNLQKKQQFIVVTTIENLIFPVKFADQKTKKSETKIVSLRDLLTTKLEKNVMIFRCKTHRP